MHSAVALLTQIPFRFSNFISTIFWGVFHLTLAKMPQKFEHLVLYGVHCFDKVKKTALCNDLIYEFCINIATRFEVRENK